MTRTFAWMSAASICLGAPPAIAAQVGNWEIERTKTGCSATRDYVDGTSLELAADSDGERGSIVLWNDDWKTIRRTGRYDIGLRFDEGPRRTYKGGGMRTDAAGGVVVFLRDIGPLKNAYNARRLVVWNGSRQVGSYSLRGSAAALDAVERCLKPKRRRDPFAG